MHSGCLLLCIVSSFSLSDNHLSGPQSDWLSTAFDVGGIIGKNTATVNSGKHYIQYLHIRTYPFSEGIVHVYIIPGILVDLLYVPDVTCDFCIHTYVGGIFAGVVSDLLKARALTCVCMLLTAVPMVSPRTYQL